MGNKARSSITVNSSILGSASITTLNSTDITVSNSLTTNTLNTENLVVHGNDVTQFLQSGGSLNANGLSGTLNNNTKTVDLDTIQHPGSYTQSSIVNPSPSSHVGFICVSLIDNANLTGSIALYTRGKMWNITVYTVIFEKNTNTDSTVSLNTDSGLLTISTTKNISFEIKALNLIEQ